MALATKYQKGLQLGVTPRMLKEAKEEAQAALDAFVKPEEVRQGQWLCSRGRVMRAMHIVGGVSKDHKDYPRYQAEFNKVVATAEHRHKQWIEAERRYRELCEKAGIEPELSEGETCTCEGCQIEAEAIERQEKALEKAAMCCPTCGYEIPR